MSVFMGTFKSGRPPEKPGGIDALERRGTPTKVADRMGFG